MATSYVLSDEDFGRIAPQIAIYLAGIFTLASESPVQLGETFEVWSMAETEGETDRQLADLAMFDGRYHHQIFARVLAHDAIRATGLGVAGQAPVGAAWSTRNTDGTWSVREVAETWLAATIDLAVRQLDRLEGVPDKAVARLLRVPAYALHAFWLVADTSDLVYVIARPARLATVPVRRLISSAEFVQLVTSYPPIRGVYP